MVLKREAQVDQGYAWMVAFSCFMINFIMAGLARAAGVLYVAVIELYGVSREAATTPFSIRFSVRNMSGPVVGILGNRFGIRATVLTGGILAGVGGILCVLSPNVFWITVFWGGVHGLGYGLCNIIHILLINQYFDKYKGAAMGFAFSGDCFGTFAFPVILEVLLENYGLNGTFLILGGIALNVIPAAMLLKTPDWLEEDTKAILDDPESKPSKLVTYGHLNKGFISESLPNLNICHKAYVSSCPPIKESISLGRASYTQIDKRGQENDFTWNGKLKNNSLSEDPLHLVHVKTRSLTNYETPELYLRAKALDSCLSQNICSNPPSCNFLKMPPNNEYLLGDRAQQNIMIAEVLKSENSASEIPQNKISVSPAVSVIFEVIPEKTVTDDLETADAQRNPFVQFIVTNTRPLFILITVTMSFFVFLFIALITIIIDYAADINIPLDTSKYLLIGFSVSDLIGRLGFGVVLDKDWIKKGHFAGVTTAIIGASVLIIPFFANFYYLMTCLLICGFVLGGNCIMYPILVEHYMDKKEESVALGCLQFYGGLLMLPLPPMIGFFRDAMGSYNGVFWTVGGLCLASGLAWILEPCLWKIQQRQLKNSPQ
ncbi:monocarboxylate transporter 9 [Trichonephila inaurata madagascariensis]|uniref:Monocarboxylate transporter 9 n=1 Tax=Trichonephila inaurata madagascariensis TaxID=2747483 RepID=A0A8X7BVA4_9ARAC|nr:monocarboxylate transporter 9 [Trichonephila inaurata madagascariensis]